MANDEFIGCRESLIDGSMDMVGADGHSYTPEEYAGHLEEQAIERAQTNRWKLGRRMLGGAIPSAYDTHNHR
ncbi:hypothetical protein OHB12_07185 [Nocardia sp. NBC_01730]|uniref:hypothetical protein n=1 Tax=Nocardia sp. NBC_01730 TaxID=2975998 RepID=UPI002E154D6A|nr:hypothetical protein OHB12_07185 [Nocardia sp. NBC_01730]